MHFQYSPPEILSINHTALKLGDPRDQVRRQLGINYKEQNSTISLGENTDPIIRRRDIYGYDDPSKYFYSLNYDKNDLLRDVEIHNCEKIQVFDFTFSFDDELDFVAKELSRFESPIKKGDGEYFFKDLRISIIDEMHMGGEENTTLSYFYCSSDVSHLIN